MKKPITAVFLLFVLLTKLRVTHGHGDDYMENLWKIEAPSKSLTNKIDDYMENLRKIEAPSKSLTNKIVYTHGGNSKNARCVFPFKYKGKSYVECTRDGSAYNTKWCATTSSYDQDKKWGNCVTKRNLRNCADRHSSCEQSALSGGCLLNPAMNKVCSRSCGMCTFGGNSEGRACVLPFIYRNRVNDECQMHNHKRWCATTSNFDVDKKWGYCFPKLYDNMTQVDEQYLTFGECDDRSLKCTAWAKKGQCDRNRRFMEETCPWSCRKCAPERLVKDGRCMDHLKNCERLVKRNHCRMYPVFMSAFCRWSCRECTQSMPGEAEVHNRRSKCYQWARNGECQTNPTFMMAYCRRSCMAGGYVKGKKYINKYANCQEWARKGYCNTNRSLMKKTCPYSCNLRQI